MAGSWVHQALPHVVDRDLIFAMPSIGAAFGDRAPRLRQQLLAWWEVHGRRSVEQKPWMFTADGRWPDPGEELPCLGVWIAEVMLQQTQLSVVLPYWRRWMVHFPSLQCLAAADLQDVLHCWQGLGYYVRARRLHQGARWLVEAGRPLPTSMEGWLALPGVGRSTAAGVLSSAFDRPAAILDGNVKRVLARLHAFPHPPQRHSDHFWSLSEALLDRTRARVFNQALMDLGALCCTPRKPGCAACPWRSDCGAYAAGTSEAFPVREARQPLPHEVIGVGIVLDGLGRVLIDQRPAEGLLGGLWEFPGGKQEPGEPIIATVARELREELDLEVAVEEELIRLDHSYTHRRLTFVVHLCRPLAGRARPLASQQVAWVAPCDLDAYPFPAANARMITALREHLAPGHR